MDYIKTILITIGSTILAYLDPIAGNIESLMALFFLNFIVGLASGIVVENERFNMHKVLTAFIWAAVICVLICAIYFIGEHNGSKDESLQCVRIVALVAIWAFGTNTFRNLAILSKGYEPAYKFFYILYECLSLELMKRLPFVKALIAEDKKKTDEALNVPKEWRTDIGVEEEEDAH